jgi:hypothetical protein
MLQLRHGDVGLRMLLKTRILERSACAAPRESAGSSRYAWLHASVVEHVVAWLTISLLLLRTCWKAT